MAENWQNWPANAKLVSRTVITVDPGSITVDYLASGIFRLTLDEPGTYIKVAYLVGDSLKELLHALNNPIPEDDDPFREDDHPFPEDAP